MMGSEEEKEDSGRRRYYYYGYGGSSNDDSKKKKDKFRVDADVQNNKLLLYANQIELDTVTNLLVELGEIPPAGGRRERTRYIDVNSGNDTENVLERLKRVWPSLAPDPNAPNPLKIEPAPKKPQTLDPEKESPKPTPAANDARARRIPSNAKSLDVATRRPVRSAKFQLAQLSEAAPAEEPETDASSSASQDDRSPEADESETDAPEDSDERVAPRRGFGRRQNKAPREPAEKAPIYISRGPDGGIVLRSDDTRALDVLEDLLTQWAPPRSDYEIFRLKNADAMYVKMNLEDYFKEEGDDKKNNGRSYYYWDYYPQTTKKNPRRLSKRRELKFIDDYDTNSILVTGADANQLRTIKSLIDEYDKPQESDSQSARLTKYFPVRYSKASTVAETIKEVYRDLLSANDKALQSNQKNQKKPNVDRIYTYIDGGSDDKHTRVRFKGLLSIGVDPLSNSLIVSAPENLMNNVTTMIEVLDEAAMPSSNVQVVKIDRRIDPKILRAKLAELFGENKKGEQPKSEDGSQKQNIQGDRNKGKKAKANGDSN
jgi:type II secretory pathway component GspD/PulD (secretin)